MLKFAIVPHRYYSVPLMSGSYAKIVLMPVILDTENQQLINGEHVIPLSDTVYHCLLLLMEQRIVSRDEMLTRCWGKKGVIVTDASVRGMLHQLRKNLSQAGVPATALVTELGKGYKLEAGHLSLNAESAAPPRADSAEQASEAAQDKPSRKRGGIGRKVGLTLPCVLLLITSLILSVMAGHARLKSLLTPVRYEPLYQQDALHVYGQVGGHFDMDVVRPVFDDMLRRRYIPQQAQYWIYVHNTKFRENASMLICNLPMSDKVKSCFTLNSAAQHI